MLHNVGLIPGERWTVLYDGSYAISDHGRVMRTSSSACRMFALYPGSINRPQVRKYGPVAFFHFKTKRFVKPIAMLVAQEFIGPCPAGMRVKHRDGDRHNVHWANLEYAPVSDILKAGFSKVVRKSRPSHRSEAKELSAKLARFGHMVKAGSDPVAALSEVYGVPE